MSCADVKIANVMASAIKLLFDRLLTSGSSCDLLLAFAMLVFLSLRCIRVINVRHSQSNGDRNASVKNDFTDSLGKKVAVTMYADKHDALHIHIDAAKFCVLSKDFL